MSEFRMPSLGADMEAGTLIEWLKHPGDAVKRGDIIAVVETQKGAIEVEVFETGVVDRLLVEPGTRVPVGVPLALIRTPGEAPAPPMAKMPMPAVEPTAPPRPQAAPPKPVTPTVAQAARPRASPAARKLAAERGVALAGLSGTGPGGAVLSADVERGALGAMPTEARPPRRGLDLTEMRKAIAAAMARSKREIPHYYLRHTIDLTPTLAWLEAANAARPPTKRLLLAVLLLKAVALAVREYPEFNGVHTAESGFRASDAVHIGAAIAIRGGGLAAPAIHDADQQTLGELMAALRDLVARCRAGRLRASELSAPTITVSSLGERGVEGLFGVIYPPQVAIVGFGAPVSRPWIVDGRVEARTVMTMTLAADHRASDGHRGALFLLEIERLLNQPEAL